MKIILNKKKHSLDWVCGKWKRHCSVALASLDFFASVFYQEKIEGPGGEPKDELKIKIQGFYPKNILTEMNFYFILSLFMKITFNMSLAEAYLKIRQ